MIYYYDNNGKILRSVFAPDNEAELQSMPGENWFISDNRYSLSTVYVDNGEIVPIPDQPSAYSTWDWETHTWIEVPDAVTNAKTDKKKIIDQQFLKQTEAPINFENTLFDADTAVSRVRISNTIQQLTLGIGLPVGWEGWRDFFNVMHWGSSTSDEVLVKLTDLFKEISNREQRLLAKSWEYKLLIDNIGSLSEILAFESPDVW